MVASLLKKTSSFRGELSSLPIFGILGLVSICAGLWVIFGLGVALVSIGVAFLIADYAGGDQ